jgi:hypothetical protein
VGWGCPEGPAAHQRHHDDHAVGQEKQGAAARTNLRCPSPSGRPRTICSNAATMGADVAEPRPRAPQMTALRKPLDAADTRRPNATSSSTVHGADRSSWVGGTGPSKAAKRPRTVGEGGKARSSARGGGPAKVRHCNAKKKYNTAARAHSNTSTHPCNPIHAHTFSRVHTPLRLGRARTFQCQRAHTHSRR